MAESEADFIDIISDKKPDRSDAEPRSHLTGLKIMPTKLKDDQEPQAPAKIVYKPSEWDYFMGGHKLMLIFNHYEYKKFKHFAGVQPPTRTGTSHDVRALQDTFSKLGFEVTTHHDQTYKKICNIISDLCARDHSNTSCVCVCVLTHGKRGGELFAADMPYKMTDLLDILQDVPGLVGKPKLLIVQAGCGGLVDSGQEVQLDEPDDEVLLPSYVDTLIIRSSFGGYSWRDAGGSWLIQELCRVVHATHGKLDVPQMVALVTSLVASKCPIVPEFDKPSNLSIGKMKQIPEMRSTLTKLLRLTTPP